MKVDGVQLRQAARSFGGWIDRKNGRVIRRGWMGNPDALFAFENGEIILLETDAVREGDLLEIPRLCPGYAELAFLKNHEEELSAFVQAYGLEQYMKENLPAFLKPDTDAAILQAGQKIWNRTLMLLEEHDFIRIMFENEDISKTILDEWWEENGI
ncbi:MAG: hypothetical protein E7335_12210 [Clostridiales bacterium]|nr:hypothetical protein [Clostridiales bacterium]